MVAGSEGIDCSRKKGKRQEEVAQRDEALITLQNNGVQGSKGKTRGDFLFMKYNVSNS